MNQCAENDCFLIVIKRLLYIALAFLTFACAKKERPDDVLTPEKMADVMVDIHLTQGVDQARVLTKDSTLISKETLQSYVFTNHSISQEEYQRSFDWYSNNLKEFDAVYARVIERLNQMEAARMVDRARN